jgi:hypothetical protein
VSGEKDGVSVEKDEESKNMQGEDIYGYLLYTVCVVHS